MKEKGIYRDVTLNNVKEEDIGKEIRIAGWGREYPRSWWSIVYRFEGYVWCGTGST